MSGEVVFLAYTNPKMPVEQKLLSCSNCRNKAFTVAYSNDIPYPALRCTACQEHIGRIGWADSAGDDK